MSQKKNSTLDAIYSRQAIRHFSDKAIPENTLLELLEAANRAPSGFNLQPWHFIVINDKETKKFLYLMAMKQRQILDAPIVLAFAADPNSWKKSYDRVLKLSLDNETLPKETAKFYRKTVSLLFRTGPLGLFGLLKQISIPILKRFKPVPMLINSASEARHYVRAQTMFAASTLMIAAKSLGIDSCPMEGFDEQRVKRLLGVPQKNGSSDFNLFGVCRSRANETKLDTTSNF